MTESPAPPPPSTVEMFVQGVERYKDHESARKPQTIASENFLSTEKPWHKSFSDKHVQKLSIIFERGFIDIDSRLERIYLFL